MMNSDLDYSRLLVGDYVKHFKRIEDSEGTDYVYKILQIGVLHTESKEKLVIYQAMYGDRMIFARPMDMFFGKVDKEKYPDVKQEFRLEKITDSELLDKLENL